MSRPAPFAAAFAAAAALALVSPARGAEAPAAPAPAAAESPFRLHFTEYSLASYHLDNGNVAAPGTASYDPTGSNYVDWLNKLQANASWGDFTGQIRLDSALFANAPQAAPGDVRMERLLQNRYRPDFQVEKVTLGYTSRHLELTVGDSYVTFGRGLVLSLRKVDEAGIDTTVRGANATVRAAGFTLQALGGLGNIVNVDAATGRVAQDTGDVILGARGEYRIGKWLKPGLDIAQVVYGHNFQDTLPQKARDQVTSYSATLEAPKLGDLGTLYLEFAQQRRLTQDTPLWSSAFYASGSAYLGRATLLLEYKDYRNFAAVQTSLDPTQVPELALSDYYTAAPTLERVQQLVLNNTNVAGPHARLSMKLGDVTPFVSMAVFADRLYGTHIYDPYLGAEGRWNGGRTRASVSGGYRLNQHDEAAGEPGALFQSAGHLEYDVNQALAGPYSVELDGLHVSHRDQQGPSYLDWREGQAYLSLKRAERWGVALGYEYYTEAPESIRSNYANVNATWHVTSDVLLRFFAGGQRAGIKCVNGVCRNYPAFEGARLEVVAKL